MGASLRPTRSRDGERRWVCGGRRASLASMQGRGSDDEDNHVLSTYSVLELFRFFFQIFTQQFITYYFNIYGIIHHYFLFYIKYIIVWYIHR